MATTVADSVCPLDCPDTCSLAVTIADGRVTSIDASPRNPATADFICAKVRRYAERVYSPLRVTRPQRRVGRKGEGRFEPMSWDEALALIAERFQRIIAEDGAEAILPYHYGGSNGVLGEEALDARFFHRLGASELMKTLCTAPTGTVARAMYGTMGGVPPEDYRLARVIVLWGVNPSATSIHLVPHVRAAQRAGATVAVIDPRCTPLARTADLHLQPRLGTDVVLALAIIDALVRRGHADRSFLAEHVNGFEELARAAADFPIQRAARECDVPAADIEALVETYARATPAVLRCGWGVERNRNGGQAVRAILAMPAVAGKLGVRGGGFTMSLSRAHPIDAVALARPDLRRQPARRINMVELGRVLTEPQSPPVRALFVYNANPAAMTPDQGRVLAGLAREDLFTVVHEQVMTDTARFADVLLPATTVFEHADLHKAYGHYVLQHSAPIIDRVGESLSNPELFARLARAMGFDEPELAATEDDLLADALRAAGGRVDRERLRRERAVSVEPEGGTIQLVTTRPTTPSGKIELCPSSLPPVAYAPLPHDPRFPLALLSPASSKLINSIFGELDLPEPHLAMHPDDAARRGLRDGEAVRVYNELGEVHVALRLSSEVRPGVVSLPKGLWRASSRNGATSTALVPATLTDIGGGACYNDARVEVAAATG